MTNLCLIRHGQAVVNVKPIIGGMRGDIGLTELGIEQVSRLRDRLIATGELQADVLIASSMPRARQTAEILAPAFGLPVILDDELQEIRPGEADGMTYTEYEATYGVYDLAPHKPLSPGGETWADFMVRVSGAYERITEQYAGQTIVLVCHGWVIEGSFPYFFGMNILELPPVEFQVANTAMTRWEKFFRNDQSRWRLIRYNDDIHLRNDVHWQSAARASAEGVDNPAVPLPDDDQPLEERS